MLSSTLAGPNSCSQASALTNLGLAALSRGDAARATQLCQESLGLFQKLGDRWGMALILAAAYLAELRATQPSGPYLLGGTCFGGVVACNGVSLDVERGEVVGIMGHNGSGKSTLLRVVSTALRPSAGEGWVFGKHLVRDAIEVRSHVGFLAHAPGLYDDLTARENLALFARLHGVADREPAIERGLALRAGEGDEDRTRQANLPQDQFGGFRAVAEEGLPEFFW